MSVLFIDFVCNKAYDPLVLKGQPLGGTEATVTRIAERLAATMPVHVLQHNRKIKESYEASYLPVDDIMTLSPKAVVVLRDSKIVPFVRTQWPKARVYLWCHDLPSQDLIQHIPMLQECECTLITVSNYLKNSILNIVRSSLNLEGKLNIEVIANPIDDDVAPREQLNYNKDKLVFLSSPHKGLEHTLKLFACLKYRHPKLELYVANPGYLKSKDESQLGVHYLGALSHERALEHVKDSFCVFYPNYQHPETFGLVFAEANAVGTPVLSHPCGAADEVLYNAELQLTDCRLINKVVDRFEAWYTYGRPEVKAIEEFRTKEVIKKWIKLLS